MLRAELADGGGTPPHISLHLPGSSGVNPWVSGGKGPSALPRSGASQAGAAHTAEDFSAAALPIKLALWSPRCCVTESTATASGLEWSLLLAHETHAAVSGLCTLALAAVALPGDSGKTPAFPAF